MASGDSLLGDSKELYNPGSVLAQYSDHFFSDYIFYDPDNVVYLYLGAIYSVSHKILCSDLLLVSPPDFERWLHFQNVML